MIPATTKPTRVRKERTYMCGWCQCVKPLGGSKRSKVCDDCRIQERNFGGKR